MADSSLDLLTEQDTVARREAWRRAKLGARKQREASMHLGKPGTFSGLMNLYEGSYERLERLLVDIDWLFVPGNDRAESRSDTDFPLHLTVLERTKYTVTLHLTYCFDNDASGSEPVQDPDITLRLYADAKQAEVMESTRERVRFLGEHDPGYVGAGGWTARQHAANVLLHKWLAYLLEHGHGFALAARPRVAAFDSTPGGTTAP